MLKVYSTTRPTMLSFFPYLDQYILSKKCESVFLYICSQSQDLRTDSVAFRSGSSIQIVVSLVTSLGVGNFLDLTKLYFQENYSLIAAHCAVEIPSNIQKPDRYLLRSY